MTTNIPDVEEVFCPTTFQPLVGDTFLASESEQLTLVEVNVFRTASNEVLASEKPVRQAFSLLFRSEHGHPLRTGIQAISHPKLGELQLAINPVHYPQGAQIAPCIYYECVFG